MTRRSISRFAVPFLSGSLLFCGCATQKHNAPKAAVTPEPVTVGRVAVVNDELHFVLVDVGSLYTPAPGTALKSFSGGTETGILAVDAEKRRPFIAADIVKGDPKVGDQVEE